MHRALPRCQPIRKFPHRGACRIPVSCRSTAIGHGVLRLEAGWRAPQLVFLARGPGPFTLAYGSRSVIGVVTPLAATPRDCYPRSRDCRRPDITGRRSSVDGLHRGISLEDRHSLGGSGYRRRLTRGDGLPPHERTEQKQHALISISSTRVTKLSEALADPVAEPGAPHQSASMIAMGSFYTNGA